MLGEAVASCAAESRKKRQVVEFLRDASCKHHTRRSACIRLDMLVLDFSCRQLFRGLPAVLPDSRPRATLAFSFPFAAVRSYGTSSSLHVPDEHATLPVREPESLEYVDVQRELHRIALLRLAVFAGAFFACTRLDVTGHISAVL